MSDYCERCGGSKSIGFSDAEPHGRACPDCNGGEETDPRLAGIAEGRRMERERVVAWLREQSPDCVVETDYHTVADRLERGEHEKGSGE